MSIDDCIAAAIAREATEGDEVPGWVAIALLSKLESRNAAIERVRTQANETLRLCRESGVPESSAHLSPQAVLRALDGPQT